jgi:hypothetical protein
MKQMPPNATVYRVALSTVGGLIIGALGLGVGAAWALGVGADTLAGALLVGAVGALWGAVAVQLTPTGGVILENRTTVNYAIFALHGWYAAFLCIAALAVWAIRIWAF